MVTVNRDLLMAFVYFDQSHCGYLLEKDLEEILYTLGLHLSRAQVIDLMNLKGIFITSFFFGVVLRIEARVSIMARQVLPMLYP